jgi:hypothetical protein
MSQVGVALIELSSGHGPLLSFLFITAALLLTLKVRKEGCITLLLLPDDDDDDGPQL